jgi:uncharacterized protein (TIGR00369 family)
MSAPKVPPPCWNLFDARAKIMEPGHSLIEFRTEPAHENPYGHVQGGLLAAMIDNCIGPAVFLLVPDRQMTTIEMKLNYLAPAHPGDVLQGEARVIKHGRTTAYVEISLTRNDGTLVARASATNVFLGPSELPEDLDSVMNQHRR